MGLNQILLAQQDGFQSKNLFRWWGFLIDFKVVAPLKTLETLAALMKLATPESSIQSDLLVMCALTLLTTESTSIILKNAGPQ